MKLCKDCKWCKKPELKFRTPPPGVTPEQDREDYQNWICARPIVNIVSGESVSRNFSCGVERGITFVMTAGLMGKICGESGKFFSQRKRKPE